jgi:hypothetical protein
MLKGRYGEEATEHEEDPEAEQRSTASVEPAGIAEGGRCVDVLRVLLPGYLSGERLVRLLIAMGQAR